MARLPANDTVLVLSIVLSSYDMQRDRERDIPCKMHAAYKYKYQIVYRNDAMFFLHTALRLF